MTLEVDKKFHQLDLKGVSEEGEFEGYASRFGQRDQGGDVVAKGAFKACLSSRKPSAVKMLWQHDPSHPIGVWDAIKEDADGLHVKGRLLLSVAKARETYELMKAGVLDGLSIGYRTIKALRDDRTGFRELKEVDLWEISVVTFPMLTSATVTSVKTDITIRDVERILREADVPNEFAKMVAAYGYDEAKRRVSGGQRDADNGLNDVADTLRRMKETLQRRL